MSERSALIHFLPKKSMRTFSKSKLMALRQCTRRLWLEVHRPELRSDSVASKAIFRIGHQVGELAQHIYDPKGLGAVIDMKTDGITKSFERTAGLLNSPHPIFEAGFAAEGAMAFADVMLPRQVKDGQVWHMVEVKSSTGVKDYYRDDVAVQAFVARTAGVALGSVSLAHIDSSWTYSGHGDYAGLLKEVDLTEEAFSRSEEVKRWIAQAQGVCENSAEPAIKPGAHCTQPYACGFHNHCNQGAPKVNHPVEWLPYFGAKAQMLSKQGIVDMHDVPDDLLNARQRRVKVCTVSDSVFFDAAGAAADLEGQGMPARFLDFETIQFAVPIWKGTRPFQFNTFQFSLHTLDEAGQLGHIDFLDLSGNDPAETFIEALILACGDAGPVYVYNAGFESSRIRELATRFPRRSEALLVINARMIDLLPIARKRYYHPRQQGSWSIKKVLPAIIPELRYDALEGVQDGGLAMEGFLEAVHPDTDPLRKKQIEQQLRAYCKLDTYALVRLWQLFAGRVDLLL